MSNTTFVDQTTVVEADWLNDINDVAYDILGNGTTVPATKAAARTNLGSTTVGDAVFTAASADAAQTSLGGTTTGKAVFTAASADAAQTSLGGTTTGKAVFTAASASAALSAIGGVSASSIIGKNKIHNGKMEIAQRGTTFTNANNQYTLDRWLSQKSTPAVFDIIQSTDVPSSNEFRVSLRHTVTTVDASIGSTDYAWLTQGIEGYNARDLIDRTFTLSFWVRSAKTGVHCVSLRNSASDRSYVVEYTVSAANTWEQKTITITGGLITAGTWNWTTGVGVTVSFALAGGSTFQTTANAWQTGNFVSTANQVNCLDTIGNIFAVTGVQLEIGTSATQFEHRAYSDELSLCQRYYRHNLQGVGRWTTTTNFSLYASFPTPMRVVPISGGTPSGNVDEIGTASRSVSAIASITGNEYGALINLTTAASTSGAMGGSSTTVIPLSADL
jgi:hypothetical protein